MWTFVPWIEEKWELGLFYFYFFLVFLFAVLKIVVFVGATVCYACKTASLLHELGSDCMHVYYVRMSLLLTLSLYVFATATAAAVAVPCECILYLFECMNCSCILLCVYAPSLFLSLLLQCSFVKVFCSSFQLFCLCLLLLYARMRNALISF